MRRSRVDVSESRRRHPNSWERRLAVVLATAAAVILVGTLGTVAALTRHSPRQPVVAQGAVQAPRARVPPPAR